MSERSSIEWTDATWNPIRARNRKTGKVGWHCQIITPGCGHCYASGINRRLGTGFNYTSKPRPEVEVFLDEKTLAAPLRWRKPRKIFVCSMSDLFAEFIPDEWIDRIFSVMALAPQHTFQVLTKRAKRMREWFERTASGADRETIVYESKPGFSEKGGRIYWPGWPLPNVWLGVSAEDQQRLDERVPELETTPAAVRFVSVEPLLGPMNLYLGRDTLDRRSAAPRIDWVIVGGESGPRARPCDVDWVRDIVRQCREAQVPCFVKQLGAQPFDSDQTELSKNEMLKLLDRKGGNPSEWREDLRVREFPEVRG